MTKSVSAAETPITAAAPTHLDPYTLNNLPSDLILKILSESDMMRTFHPLSLTCKQINVSLHADLSQVLSLWFPHFKKTDPNQDSFEALKSQYRLDSNLTKGVYGMHFLQNSGPIHCLAIDQNRVFSGSRKGEIKIWDLNI